MSGSYTFNPNIILVNGSYRYSFSPNGTITQNGLGSVGAVISVPTTVTDISLSALTTPGFLFLQNLDATNYVDVGSVISGTFYPFLRIKVGEFAICRINPSITLAMQANTAAAIVSYTVQED